jgi:hypothetical protein
MLPGKLNIKTLQPARDVAEEVEWANKKYLISQRILNLINLESLASVLREHYLWESIRRTRREFTQA